MSEPLAAFDFVRMYLSQTDHHPAQGHYLNAVACRRKAPSGVKDDAKSRCTRCDGERILKEQKRAAISQRVETALAEFDHDQYQPPCSDLAPDDRCLVCKVRAAMKGEA